MNDQAAPPGSGIANDPVCGMEVAIDGAIDGAQHVLEYEGTTYYFCAKGCRLDFEEDPKRILAPDYEPSM